MNRNTKHYDYQYYLCKSCGYKVAIEEVHNRFIPKILNRVKELISTVPIVPKTLAAINEMSIQVKQSVESKQKIIKILEGKLNTARDLEDRELELKILEFIQHHNESLKDFANCQENLRRIHQLVESDQFFPRFDEILNHQLGLDEVRLIILYFVECLIVSTEQQPQLLFKSNIFSDLNISPIG
ncbi:hypothetical protein GJU40_16010 [Bacillus lacus]|uniref:Recombinase zinc beta ribbon domain-containing protein n=1 Tax=Metabacillus lacus TaxID=1983721 RepID=A0A7X2J1Y5_9BACI|nr:hypothetical protein [Metabacillus lacus]MRX73647.1 hypothetical protein [Metabacillus lacus]